MKGLIIKILFFINHIFSVLFMCHMEAGQSVFEIQSTVPLLLATIFLTDITYIVSGNLRDSSVLNLFGGLLAIDSWYLLLSPGKTGVGDLFFLLLNPIIITVSIKFCFLFLFQGYKYKYKKATDILLMIFCAGSLSGVLFSAQVYAGMFGIQFTGSIFCFLFLIAYHWKRVWFVLKNEWRIIGFSLGFTALLFMVYYVMTINLEDHLGNFGMYLVVLIFSMSIHGIAFKESNGIPLTSICSLKQSISFVIAGMAILYMMVSIMGLTFTVFVIMINVFLALIFLANIIIGQNLKHDGNTITKNSRYIYVLNQLRNEEKLKNEFAVFLHDEVLQDLLAVKNMTARSHLPEVQKIIYETLDNLNVLIRNQMQNYHPVILKSMTLKENYDDLIEGISETFPDRDIKVSFKCPDNIFLTEPYDMLIYRWIKELLTNVLKHSDGNHAWITLSMAKNKLKLSVCDDGSEAFSYECAERRKNLMHKGLSSIKEQVESLSGNITFSKNNPQGVCIEIELMMNGGNSYKYFIS